jgi:choline dehydrogenase-like flavoprotein
VANLEVILCGGAFLSPQLLMLSGIGPSLHLRETGIKTVVDLPVGENLQDHPGCFLSYLSNTPDLSDADTPEHEAELRRAGRGPLTWAEAGGFVRINDEHQLPDVQYHVAPGMFRDEGLSMSFGSALSFGPYVNRPESRGRVTLRSAHPLAKPRIINNFLAAPRDRDVLREGLRIGMEVAQQPALRQHLLAPRRSVEAGLLPRSTSTADLDEYMRAGTFSFYHPSGTCAMGQVVDSELRVLGIDGLRVADTSIMPYLVGGNTNAPAIMIGEKASDFIRDRSAPERPATARSAVRT